MFAADCFEVDQETSQVINQIWLPEHWEMAAKFAGDPEIFSLAGVIRYKLHQVRYNLENILQQDQKKKGSTGHSKQVCKISTFIVKCEMESLLLTLNQIMDLMAGMISTVYGIKTDVPDIGLRDFFPSLINSKPFFNELQRKDPILAEQLTSFYFSSENKLMMKFLTYSGKGWTGRENRKPGNEGYLFDTQTIIEVEGAYRKIVCLLGQIMFDHLNLEPILIQYFSEYRQIGPS